MYSKVILCLILCIINFANSAKILAAVPIASFSHQNAFRPIWKELSRRGHQVTLITTDPIADPTLTNLTEIDISIAYDVMRKHKFSEKVQTLGNDIFKFWKLFTGMNDDMNDQVLGHPEIQNLIHNDSIEFDLFMGEHLSILFLPLAQRFKVPSIGVVSLDASIPTHDCFGNPTHPIANPEYMLPFISDLTFRERLTSVGYLVFIRLLQRYMLHIFAAGFSEKYYGPDYAPVSDLFCNIDMLFINANPILDNIRPMVPGVINIGGGLHIQDPKPLPKELKEYLDSSKRGLIYFSLGGTNVQSKNLPENMKETIKQTLAEVPYDVLWKYEDDEMPNKPENVKLIKWAPQHDLLKHPNVKLFITQGGLQSLEEALFSYVPVIGIPFFGDQQANMKKVTRKGLGMEINKDNLEKETFKNAIIEVISNPKYVERIKDFVELSKDLPMSGLEQAIWWTEYVIRHKGAQHLKGPATKIPFYQYYLLDVIAFLIAVISITIIVIAKTIKLTLRLMKKLFCIATKIKTN